jgi:hypothetical protein
MFTIVIKSCILPKTLFAAPIYYTGKLTKSYFHKYFVDNKEISLKINIG